jgi:peptide/nickel transport system permease protein
MRLTDSLLTLPRILVAIIVAAAVGASFQTLVLVVGCLVWMSIARLVRAETKTVQNKEFVSYARAIGVPSWVIILRHILPNVFPVLIVVTTLEISHVIMLEAGLSFLGAGLPPPQPSWGGMIADGRSLISTGWWIALFPGLMIVVTILSCNGIGDWLRDFLDPKTRQRGY